MAWRMLRGWRMHTAGWSWLAICFCLSLPAWGEPARPRSFANALRTTGYRWNGTPVYLAAISPGGGPLAMPIFDQPGASARLSVRLFQPMVLGRADQRLAEPTLLVGSFGPPMSLHETRVLNFSDGGRSSYGCADITSGVLGTGAGILCMVFDATVFASAAARRREGFYLVPTFDLRARSAGFAVGGSLF